jgi:hypothetical protein
MLRQCVAIASPWLYCVYALQSYSIREVSVFSVLFLCAYMSQYKLNVLLT